MPTVGKKKFAYTPKGKAKAKAHAKKTGDIFYKDKPRGESPWEKLGGPSHNKPIEQKINLT